MKAKRVLVWAALLCWILPVLSNCPTQASSSSETIEWQPDQQGYVQFMTKSPANLDTTWYIHYPPVLTPMNTATVTAIKNSGNADAGFGMIYCVSDLQNFYRVLITTSGYFNICKKVGGKYFIIRDWTQSGLIGGTGAATTISVTSYGAGSFTLFLNGRLMSNFDDSTFTGGTMGFYVYVSDAEEFPGTPVDVRFHMTPPIQAAVTTFAGSAVIAGSSDGVGSTARFSSPAGITSDGTNLYVADVANHTIRQIAISTADVSTLAGTAGSLGSSDGTGPAARFNCPSGVACDGTNLYVADSFNYTIRKIVISSREVTTLAGSAGNPGSSNGTGSGARFGRPLDITHDGENLYVVDSTNHCIRKVVISTGEVTTLAGDVGVPGTSDGTGSSARFNWPYGIATDGTNLYVSDCLNHAIRKIVISSGKVTTIAGEPGIPGFFDGAGAAAWFNQPRGIMMSGPNLYVLDYSNATVRMIESSTGEVSTLAGRAGCSGTADGPGPVARFEALCGITTDNVNLYLTDSYGNTIRKIVISPSMPKVLVGMARGNWCGGILDFTKEQSESQARR
jgi:hypothetical protein